MDPDTGVDFDFSPFLVRYKSGRVHRLMGAPRFNAGTDAATGVTCKDIVMDAADAACGIAARLYLPKDVPRSAKVPILVYLHGDKDPLPSESRNNPGFLRRAERSWGFVCSWRYGIDHPFINPLAMPAEEWAALGCRRALVTAAGLDTMRDRARRYVETLRGSGEWAGEEAALYETDGEGHVYFLENSGPGADKAQKELDAVVLFIKRS